MSFDAEQAVPAGWKGKGERMSKVLDELGVSPAAGFRLELIAGQSGLDRPITNPYPQKTGLALSGFDAAVKGGRVLIFGESEIRYLESLDLDGL